MRNVSDGARDETYTDFYGTPLRNYGFKDNEGPYIQNEYLYDRNGNMIKDYNKGIENIYYNHLNLPWKLVAQNQTIEYIYTANGQKLRKIAPDGTVTNYVGSIVYQNNAIKYILHGEGMYQFGEGQNPNQYEYHIKDHLGNTRVVVSQNGEELQQSAYYPFGMAYMQANSGTSNKYLYNGKELQDDLIADRTLDWYDYGARMYDPALGRWFSIDNKAEKYYNISPYNYVENNPILYIDPDGEDKLCCDYF